MRDPDTFNAVVLPAVFYNIQWLPTVPPTGAAPACMGGAQMLQKKPGNEVVSAWGTEATLQCHESPVNSIPNPGAGLPYWLSSRLILVETAGELSSTAVGTYCHWVIHPTENPLQALDPHGAMGAEAWEGAAWITVMFLRGAAEKMTGTCSYIPCREQSVKHAQPVSSALPREVEVTSRTVQSLGKAGAREAALHPSPLHQPHRGKRQLWKLR